MTAFSGYESIQGKFARYVNAKKKTTIMNEYVAVKRANTVPHNTLGDLHHSGPETPLQSYVHLDYGFWIEQEYLTKFTGDCRKLTSTSYQHLMSL